MREERGGEEAARPHVEKGSLGCQSSSFSQLLWAVVSILLLKIPPSPVRFSGSMEHERGSGT